MDSDTVDLLGPELVALWEALRALDAVTEAQEVEWRRLTAAERSQRIAESLRALGTSEG